MTVTNTELLERRYRYLGRHSPLFYENPLHIVRGEGVWLWDADGNRYLDAYNNVPHVGHCHPHVVKTVSRQLATMNSNTRYLFDNVVAYSERLGATMPGTSHYAASKGGMNGFIRTAALEFARENITVNGVEPGYILTQAMSALGDEEELKQMASFIPKGKLGKVEDIANTMLFLASDEGSYITGQTIVVDGGSTLPESPVVLEEFYKEKGQA
jgi:hypothetical protein